MSDIKLVVLDLDGTVVKYDGRWHSSWDAIGFASGRKDQYDRLCAYYYPRKNQYNEWIQKIAGLLDGCLVSDVKKYIFPPPYLDGVKDTVAFLGAEGCVCGLLTSGVDIVADRVKQDMHLDFSVSNRLIVRDGVFSGNCEHVVNLWHKEKKLNDLCRKFGVSLKDTLFIGDNENDISSMKVCGRSIAFSPKTDEVRDAADVSFESWSGIKKYIEDSILS